MPIDSRLVPSRTFPLFCLLFVSVIPAARGSDPVTYKCKTSTGWAAYDQERNPATDTELTATDGKLVYSYPRAKPRMLVHFQAAMTAFEKLTLRLKSHLAITLVVSLGDPDRARFMATAPLAADTWQVVALTPNDFRVTDDSPVKKDALDSYILENGYVLLDLGSTQGAKGENTIEIDSVEIVTGSTSVR